MCRLAAYLGEPLYLEELIAKPRHSLMHQSLRAEEAKVATNGDGFGVGWYGEREVPGVYRDATPAWADDNLMALSHTLRSRLFFAHVRAATAGANSRQNCHPFRYGKYLFMHNGQIGGYAQLRRTLESGLPDTLYAARKGATDSELLFLLAMARVEAGAPLDEAMLGVLDDTVALMRERGIHQPLRFAAVMTDGERLVAFRMSTDSKPPTLYLRRCCSGTIIASEPLGDELDNSADHGDACHWQLMAPGATVLIDGDSTRHGSHRLAAVAPQAAPGADIAMASEGAEVAESALG
jgi:glutamine amidotransferase